MQFMTRQADLEFCLLDVKSDRQPNSTPDSDPGRRTCSGKICFVENELQDLEKNKFMYLKLFKTSFVGVGPS